MHATPNPNPTSPGALPKLSWGMLLRHNDVVLAVAVVLIVGMLLIPLPPLLLDLMLTVNIALSITILLVTLYTDEPLQYSTFPTILLVTTLYRLGLNVSSTRLILLNGEAGSVIEAFGQFVVGGNFVVGFLLFLILIVINFIVITNGAGRVSEVSARFILDAMPGKQLSIDADLNAGVIDDKEAKRRRAQIQKEADFYGTMDGASKFVKGDAIAALIITAINLIGGLVIGMAQQGMTLQDAAATFTLLSVGEGLVSQVPALVISVATGILVTRVTEKDVTLGQEIGSQMFNNPKVLGVLGALLGLLGLVPGLPNIPFLLIGTGAGVASFFLNRHQAEEKVRKEQEEALAKVQEKKKTTSESVLDLIQIEPLELEIGYRLVTLLENKTGGDLLDRIAQIRKQVALELGFVLPSIRVRDNLKLPPTSYQLKLRGVMVAEGEVMPDMWLAMTVNPEGLEPLEEGIPTKEPAFGLPATWVDEYMREDAEVMGYTLVSPSAVISTHITETIRRNAAEILSRQEVQTLLDHLKKTHEPLVSDLIPDTLAVGELHLVLQGLLREKVSIRDLATILEALSFHAKVNKDPEFLVEQARLALSRSLCKQYQQGDTGELPVITLSQDIEETLLESLTHAPGASPGTGATLALASGYTQELMRAINQSLEQVMARHATQPVILCNGRLRLPFRRLTERMLPQIGILSYSEVSPTIKVKVLGMVRMGADVPVGV